MEDEQERGFPSVWGRSSDLDHEDVNDGSLEYDAFEQVRMLGDMDPDNSLLPETEVFGHEQTPRQPNSKDAADTLTQFAFRLQGETKVRGGNASGAKGGGGAGGGAGGGGGPENQRGRKGQQQQQQQLYQQQYQQQQQDAMVPKTWDVLQQVITKVSKEQNTSITLHGITMDIKMRVFVCNSVEARAVGEYVTAHKEQRPAPFVVLARQLSMAIAYNSEHLDPSQAAVADRLRKQAKTRAVKEIREAMRDAPTDISPAVLRGYVGALAPAAHIEGLLLRRTVKVDLEGDEERAYIFFDAKNRSTAKEGSVSVGVEVTQSIQPHLMPTPLPAPRGRKTPPIGHPPRQPHQSPVNARVQALQVPGSPLSPGGRDGAAALLSLFNSVSAPDSPRGPGGQPLPRHRPFPAGGEYFGQAPGQELAAGMQGGAPTGEVDKVPERPLSGRSHPKHSLAAQAAANANALAPHGTAAASSFGASRATTGSSFSRVPRPQVAIPDVEGSGADLSGGLQAKAGGYDLNLVISSPKLRSQNSCSALSIDLPHGCLLDAGARTPRSVVSGGFGGGLFVGSEACEHKLYAAVNAGDITQVQQLLETQEGMRMVDDPISSQAACGNGQSRSLQRHHLIPDSIVEYEVEDGVWWPAVVVSSIPGAEHVTVRYHRPGAQAPFGEPPLSRETKLDKKSSKLRLPSDSPKDFTALMCACMLDEESDAYAMTEVLLKHKADPNRTDSEGFSSVHWAAVKGHRSVLTLLLEKKALVDAPSTLSGETPLLLAARFGRKEAVEVLMSSGAAWEARSRQRMGLIEMVTTGSARGQDCTGVLHFVLNRQPALRTLLLHASHAWCAAAGGGSEEVVASEAVVGEVVEALQQRYTPQILTIERLDSLEQAEEGMSSLVRHAVEQVVNGQKRNCCCCLPYASAAGRRPSAHAVNGAVSGMHLELIAAQHASDIDQRILHVAVLDLDGSGGDQLEEEARRLVQERLSTRATRDSAMFFFSPDTSGSDSEGRNLAMNIFRPSVGCKHAHASGHAHAHMLNGGADAGGKLSVAGTRELLRQAIVAKLVPCLRAYSPDVVIMSATYPSALPRDDVLEPGAPVPLAMSDYEWATREIVNVAGICCKGRVVSLALVHGSADSSGASAAEKKGGEGGSHAPTAEQLQSFQAHMRALVGC